MAIKEIKTRIKNIENQSTSVRLFTLDLEEELEFKSGQFVNLIFEDEGEKFMKPYSIASSPVYKNSIQLSIKLVPEGKATPHLWNKKEADKVTIKGPFGLFTIKGNKDKLVFIGTGTGIAPLRSMIQNLLFEEKSQKELTLIFGCRHEEEILFKEEFERFEKENPNFRYIKIVSRPSENWEGRSGHVQDNFDVIDPMNSEVYICGLPAMFDGAKQKLLKMGIDEKDIYHEVFR